MRVLNIRIGRISHWLAAGYSWCHRCLTAWCFVKSHPTSYTEYQACFPLCEKCWRELSPDERLPYYRQLWQEWQQWDDLPVSIWTAIERAVAEGR